MPAPITVDFYFSPASPYAYLASTQMLQLQIETRCRVDWYPVSARALVEGAGFTVGAAAGTSGQFAPDYRREDIARWARLFGVPCREYSGISIPNPRRLALGCVAARRFDAGQVFARALMKAIFVDGPDVIDDALMITIANDTAGIVPELFTRALDEPETTDIHDALAATAVADGCFGVPSFVVRRPDGSRERVFGNDRLPLLRQAIREAQAAG